jgi:hypothetical protein
VSWTACGIVICVAFVVLVIVCTGIPQRRPRNRRRRVSIVRRLLNSFGAWCQERRLRSIRLPSQSSDLPRCERAADWRSQVYHSRFGDPT